jgi:hypothetical protein
LVVPSRWLISHKKSFIANRRGAVAFETLIVISLVMIPLLLSLADLGTACFQFLSGWQTLSSFGEYAQNYTKNNPPDYSNISGWASNLRTSWTLNGRTTGVDSSTLQVVCGDTTPPNPPPPCSQINNGPPRRFLYTTTVNLWLRLLGPFFKQPDGSGGWIKCSNHTPCSVPLHYSEPFQQ